MKRPLQLALILSAGVAVCSVASHCAVRWLKINTTYGGHHYYGQAGAKAGAILHGSSLAYDGIDWGKVAASAGGGIESWATPGSSPAEWELMHQRSPGVTNCFVVVSPYDLNDYFLCDFRADVVPLSRTAVDLWQSGADWQFCKRVVSQYPMTLVRKLFPTVGRSDGVMTGIRDKLQKLAQGKSSLSSGDAPRFGSTAASQVTEKVSEWPAARLQRRLVLMRGACQGGHSFQGPKRMALGRLLERAGQKGSVTLIVMPVSPIYQKELLSPALNADFEMVLTGLQRAYPNAKLVRLDLLPALKDSDLFSDLVHLNMYGQRIATAALLSQFEVKSGKP